MKVINKKMCVVFVLVILEISSLFLMYKSNSNKEIKLDNIEIKEINNSGLAIMIEQSNGSYSQYTTTNTWPSDTTYVLNPLKSGCVDNKGNKVENGMTFDKANRKIIVNTNKTSNCYAYFTRSAKYKVQNSSNVWNSTLAGDGYRYIGNGTTKDSVTDPKNYVCFGTQSKSECVSNPSKYMYRIIGMFQEENGNGTINTSSDYHLKLIKKEPLNQKYAWHHDNTKIIKWSESDIFKGINSNYFVTNMDYSYMRDNYWYSKIFNWKWTSVNNQNNNEEYIDYWMETIRDVYLDELNRTGKPSYSNNTYEYVNAKIGLMYASDYGLSLGSVALDYSYTENIEMTGGWMFISNNNVSSGNDMTISIYGIRDSAFNVYYVTYLGSIVASDASAIKSMAVRPVFYLNSDVVICAGSGTSSDPYILG